MQCNSRTSEQYVCIHAYTCMCTYIHAHIHTQVAPLVAHMSSEDPAIRKAALGCVRNLSANSRSKAHVLRENGLQPLIAFLTSHDEEMQENARYVCTCLFVCVCMYLCVCVCTA